MTPTQIILRIQEELYAKGSEQGGLWGRRHAMAWEFSNVKSAGNFALEGALRDAIIGWAHIGEAHGRIHGSPIGRDQVLGKAWRGMALALLIMLNGELGRFDGGTLDRMIREIAESCGVSLDE